MFKTTLAECGLIGILRGLQPEHAAAVGAALYAAGLRLLEVPLNSPDPLLSIRILRDSLPADCWIGAGTVLQHEQVRQVKAAGGQFIVMPHSDVAIVQAGKDAGLFVAPGVATPTEAFAALKAGADILKLFPAEQIGPAVIKAWLAVLPVGTALVPVGGITPSNMAAFCQAGVAGFGLGSGLFKPEMTPETIAKNAQSYRSAWQRARAR